MSMIIIHLRISSRKLNIVQLVLSVISASKAYSFVMLTLNHAFCQVIVNTDCVLINNIFLLLCKMANIVNCWQK